jgi:hypothetical protein
MRISPVVGRRMPVSSLSVVLLPAPLGPMMPQRAPELDVERQVAHRPELVARQRDRVARVGRGARGARRPGVGAPGAGATHQRGDQVAQAVVALAALEALRHVQHLDRWSRVRCHGQIGPGGRRSMARSVAAPGTRV